MEEWTREETGVGAAMAAGSQEEKGIWALLVKAVKINKKEKRKKNKKSFLLKFFMKIDLFGRILRINHILIIINLSPIRFITNVKIPAFNLEKFWKKITKQKLVTPRPSHPIIILIKLGEKIKITIEITKRKRIIINRLKYLSLFIYSLQ